MAWKILGITPGDSDYREDFCLLGIGDCDPAQKSSVDNDINNDTDISVTISTTLNLGSKTAIAMGSLEKANITIGALGECCPGCSPVVQETYIDRAFDNPFCPDGVTIVQTSTQEASAYSKLDTKTFSKMSAKLQSQISNKIKNDVAQLSQTDINALANILGTNKKSSDVSTNITNSVTETINQSFTKNVVNQILVNTVSTKTGELLICAPVGGSCTINQDAIQKVQTSNVLNSLANVVQSASAISKISNAVKTTVVQEDEGILGGIAGIIKQLGPIVIGALAVGVLLVIIVIIVLIVAKSRKKSGTVVMAPGTQPILAPRPQPILAPRPQPILTPTRQ